MRCTVAIAGLSALLVATLALGARGDASPEDVARWEAVLQHDAGDTPVADRERALAALQAIGAGPVDVPATREALFALADYWSTTDTPTTRRGAIRAIAAATELFPLDPRTRPLLPTLAALRLQIDDAFGAHLAYQALLDGGNDGVDDETIARAAANAATVSDFERALAWSTDVDPDTLDLPAATWVHLARLQAGEALNRIDMALASAAWLESHARESFRMEPRALLAAARTHETSGLLDEAAEDYLTFVNVHARDAEHAEGLLALARLYERTGAHTRAARFLQWLIDEHPHTPQADAARLELVEIDGAPATVADIPTYLGIFREDTEYAGLRLALDRFIGRYVAAGLPVEMLAALADVADDGDDASADDTTRFRAAMAREAVGRAVDPAIELLASRKDAIGIASVSAIAERAGVPIPDDQRAAVARARRAVGLPPVIPGPVEAAIADARSLIADDKAGEAVDLLQDALRSDYAPWPPTVAEADRLLAEALWRAGRADDALARLDAAVADASRADGRALRVLRADILFSEGDVDAACPSYAEAGALAPSPWVARQLERCAAVHGAPVPGDAS